MGRKPKSTKIKIGPTPEQEENFYSVWHWRKRFNELKPKLPRDWRRRLADMKPELDSIDGVNRMRGVAGGSASLENTVAIVELLEKLMSRRSMRSATERVGLVFPSDWKDEK